VNLRRSDIQAAMPAEMLDDYRSRLVDVVHHTLQSVVDWLAAKGIPACISIIHRDRTAALAPLLAIAAKRDLAIALTQQGEREGWPLAKLNAALAGQTLFDLLADLDVSAMKPETIGQVVRLFEATATLRGVEAKAEMVDLQRRGLEGAVNKARQAAEGKAAANADGKLTREDVYAILDDVMKGAA